MASSGGGGFYRFVIRRSVNMLVVLFATLVLTIALLGPTMDRILADGVKYYVVEDVSHKNIKFKSAEERQQFIDAAVARNVEALGLDERGTRPSGSSTPWSR